MDCSTLILITAVILWGAVALLLLALLIREALDRRHGAHHPTHTAFHTVHEITQRIHHERRLPPPRIITIHSRTTNAANTTITLPTMPNLLAEVTRHGSPPSVTNHQAPPLNDDEPTDQRSGEPATTPNGAEEK